MHRRKVYRFVWNFTFFPVPECYRWFEINWRIWKSRNFVSQQKYNRLQSNRNDSSIANRYLRAGSRPECIMSWRIVVISKRAKLDYQLGYLVVRNEEVTKIHLSEISTILIESTAATVTTSLLAELTKKENKSDFLRWKEKSIVGTGWVLRKSWYQQ